MVIPITEVKNFVLKHCLVCEDFTSELADISIGSDGSPEGWSTVIVRTLKGVKIFTEFERNDRLAMASASPFGAEGFRE